MTLETTATTLDEDVIAAEPGGGDVVEGATDAPDIASITVGAAASEYFEWCEEREAQREKRAQRRSNGGAPAARSKKAALPFDKAARVSVTRFVSHCSPHLPISELTPHGMASFQETIGSNATDVGARLHPVKEFLRFCWKTRNYTDVNLGNHLRVKRVSEGAAGASLEHEAAERFEMTADGLEHLKVDLERLQQEMPEAILAVAQAREDKDIRENAPLEAAREHQERLKSRIDEIEYQIGHAVVSEGRATGRAHLGSTVRVQLLDTADERIEEYTLVGPTEVDAPQRRISVESPVGKGLVDTSIDSIVEVEAPRGTMRYRVVSVEG